ncbi:MAG: multifunctional CCA tRNA nucleotidyl transferase/2'3'-cyclic phosphodiesterase/2'nucleotidase/phosphatase [Burkholderiaceae bacterium]
MQIYRVGGSVRDELLGEPSHDSDWVVVGGTPDEMIAAGYQPVGRDFPVFLHPATHEEYALARTERKTAAGYRGFAVHFAPDVTLEQDLSRRDLTINAMAMTPAGELVDPFGGRRDLADKTFRHVSPAFVEDPVRILRLARFAARLTDFQVHPDTLALMRVMVAQGEVDALVPERVWQEVSRGLMAAEPARMIAVLADCHALPRVLPGIAPSAILERALACAVRASLPLAARYALLVAAGGHGGPDPLADHLRVPGDCRDLARLLTAEEATLAAADAADARTQLALLERLDALRRPERVPILLQASRCLRLAQGESEDACARSTARLTNALQAVRDVDAGAIAKAAAPGGPQAIRQALAEARSAAIAGRR